MRIKTYKAANTQAAMAKIRDDLGDEAIIISTKRESDNSITVTAALDQAVAEFAPDYVKDKPSALNAAATANQSDDRLLAQLEAKLNYHAVPPALMDQLMETAHMIDFPETGNDDELRGLLAKLLHASYRFLPLPINRGGFKAMLVGPAGVGKTTTLAKMAAQLVMDHKPVTVITCDTNRAGGVEQLTAFTDILNIPLQIAENPQQLQKIIAETNTDDSLLIDSFGCNSLQSSDLDELRSFMPPKGIEPILTLSAGGHAEEAAEIAESFAFMGIRRMIVTRCDTTRRFGSLLNAAYHANLAFCNQSYSPRVIGEFKPLGSQGLAQLMMGLNDDGTK